MKKERDTGVSYLFVDIEWNQKAGTTDPEGAEPLQIAIIGTDNNLEYKKRFSKRIRLSDIDTFNEDSCKVMHLTKDKALEGKTEEEIFARVKQTFPSYENVVVWNRTTYDLFRRGMKRAGIAMPRHRLIVLQEVLSRIMLGKGMCIGFVPAMKRAGVAYETQNLHYAKHDARYLYELYVSTYRTYEKLTEKETGVLNTESKIVHDAGCRYVKGRGILERVDVKKLLFHGYRACACCGTDAFWKMPESKKPVQKKGKRPQLREAELTEETIQQICAKYGMKHSTIADVVFLTTPVGYWRVYVANNKVTRVFHGNTRTCRAEWNKKHKKCNEGFHKQDITMDNFYDVVQYIFYHDKAATKRKKTKLDMLFEKVAGE